MSYINRAFGRHGNETIFSSIYFTSAISIGKLIVSHLKILAEVFVLNTDSLNLIISIVWLIPVGLFASKQNVFILTDFEGFCRTLQSLK